MGRCPIAFPTPNSLIRLILRKVAFYAPLPHFENPCLLQLPIEARAMERSFFVVVCLAARACSSLTRTASLNKPLRCTLPTATTKLPPRTPARAASTRGRRRRRAQTLESGRRAAALEERCREYAGRHDGQGQGQGLEHSCRGVRLGAQQHRHHRAEPRRAHGQLAGARSLSLPARPLSPAQLSRSARRRAARAPALSS